MISIINLHRNLLLIANKKGLTGDKVVKLAAPLGGISMKTWSNLTREGFDPQKDGNLTLRKLDILSQVVETPSTELISTPGDKNVRNSSVQMKKALGDSLVLMLDTGIIDQKEFERLNEIHDLIAAAQYEFISSKGDSTSVLKKVLSSIAKKTGLSK